MSNNFYTLYDLVDIRRIHFYNGFRIKSCHFRIEFTCIRPLNRLSWREIWFSNVFRQSTSRENRVSSTKSEKSTDRKNCKYNDFYKKKDRDGSVPLVSPVFHSFLRDANDDNVLRVRRKWFKLQYHWWDQCTMITNDRFFVKLLSQVCRHRSDPNEQNQNIHRDEWHDEAAHLYMS